MSHPHNELRTEFFKHFNGRDRSDPSTGKYITLMELWKWIEEKISLKDAEIKRLKSELGGKQQ